MMKLVDYHLLLVLLSLVGYVAGDVKECYDSNTKGRKDCPVNENKSCFVNSVGGGGCSNHADNLVSECTEKKDCHCNNELCNKYVAPSTGTSPVTPSSKLNCYVSKDGDLGYVAPCSYSCYITTSKTTDGVVYISSRGCSSNGVTTGASQCGDFSSIVSKDSTCYCNEDKCNGVVGSLERKCYVGFEGDCYDLSSMHDSEFSFYGNEGKGLGRCGYGYWENRDETNMCRKATITFGSKKCITYSCAYKNLFAECTNRSLCGYTASGDNPNKSYKKKLPKYEDKEMTIEETLCSGSKCNNGSNTGINLALVLALIIYMI